MEMRTTDIKRLVALYLTLQPISKELIATIILDPLSQSQIIKQLLGNPHLDEYPPTPEYQRRVWKSIIAALEENEMEVDEEIYAHFITLMSIPIKNGPPEASYLTYLLRRPDSSTIPLDAWRRLSGADNFDPYCRPITIIESRTTIERGTTGLRTWRASLDLAEWFLVNSDLVSSARVLELGSGTGLLGLMIATVQQLSRASLSAEQVRDHPTQNTPCVYMTDVDEAVLARCAANVRLPCNLLSDTHGVQVRALDWTDSTSPNRIGYVNTILDEVDANIVLAADVVYDPSIIPPLTRTLRLALDRPLSKSNLACRATSQRVAYVALTLRREETFAEFTRSAKQEGIAVEFVDMHLPPRRDRVFCGDDEISLSELGSTISESAKLMRLTIPDS